MTINPDGDAYCDNCGISVGNAGIDKCIVVTDLNKDVPGTIINYHFCREQECDKRILAPTNLETYLRRRKAAVDE